MTDAILNIIKEKVTVKIYEFIKFKKLDKKQHKFYEATSEFISSLSDLNNEYKYNIYLDLTFQKVEKLKNGILLVHIDTDDPYLIKYLEGFEINI